MNKFNIEVNFDDSDEKLPEEGLYYIKTIDERYIVYFFKSDNQIYCRFLFEYKNLEWYPTILSSYLARHLDIVHKRPVKEIKIKV